jgi:hypothetical protein
MTTVQAKFAFAMIEAQIDAFGDICIADFARGYELGTGRKLTVDEFRELLRERDRLKALKPRTQGERLNQVLSTISERKYMDGKSPGPTGPYAIYVPESWSKVLDEYYISPGPAGMAPMPLRRRLEQIEGVTKVLLNMHGDYIKVEKAE